MVATTLEINENAMLKELNKYNHIQHSQHIPQQRVVTNSSQFEFKAQKNLLSVFLSNNTSNNYQKLNDLLPQDIIQDETLIIVKNTIDKLACTVNNVSELTKNLYTEFIEDDNLTQILTDLIEMSEAFAGLDGDELEKAVREIIIRLNRCYQEKESEDLRKQYREVNDNDIEALIDEVEYYIEPLFNYINSINDVQRKELKRFFGGGADNKFWRSFQKVIAEARDDFNPEGLFIFR